MKGRKRHLAVDTMGLVVALVVTSAGLQDDHKDAVGALLLRMRAMGSRLRRLREILADGMYEGSAVLWAVAVGGWAMRIVRRAADAVGFTPLPRRWVVERTFAWLGRYRRLSKDYEEKTDSSEVMIYLAMIYLAMIHLMARRLTPD